MTILSLIDRYNDLFLSGISSLERENVTKIRDSRFLVTDLAGSIGQALV